MQNNFRKTKNEITFIQDDGRVKNAYQRINSVNSINA